MELTVCDAGGRRLAVVGAFEMEAEAGGDERWELRLPASRYADVPLHGYVYADGTAWGGVVDSKGADWSQAAPQAVFAGRTWRGMLAGLVVMPGDGHYVARGDANRAIDALLRHAGAPAMFSAPGGEHGAEVSVELPRFCTLLEGLSRVAQAAGGSLSAVRARGRVVVSVGPRASRRLTPAECRLSAMRHARPVNHLVCAGEGQEGERALVHLYADESGAVSREQTLFGADEVAMLYSYTSADAAQLEESGRKKLAEAQEFFEASADAPEGAALEVGGSVAVADPDTGLSAVMEVESASVEVGRRGATESYRLALRAGSAKEARLWP